MNVRDILVSSDWSDLVLYTLFDSLESLLNGGCCSHRTVILVSNICLDNFELK